MTKSMRVMTLDEFAQRPRRYLNGRQDVVVMRAGKPLAIVSPLASRKPIELIREMGAILRSSGVSKRAALKMLDASRAEIYR
jgi:hypothetical protein